MTFGKLISEARKKKGLSQKEFAALVKKEDGTSISPQYLNDIEHSKRNPPSDEMLSQMAGLLDIDLDFLYFHAGQYPEDIRDIDVTEEKVKEAYMLFRKTLQS